MIPKNEALPVAKRDNAQGESEDESISDYSSCSSNSNISSSSNEISLYSIPDIYKADLSEWKKNFTEKSKQKKHITEGNMELFCLFVNQCSLQMITELKSTDKFKGFETNQDGIGLLGLIRVIVCSVKKHL